MKKMCLLLIMMLTMAAGASLAAEIVMITNNANPIDSLSAKDVKNIYLGKMVTWSDGSTIEPFSQKNAELTNVLVDEYVKKSPQQYFLYWQNRVFTGKGTPPTEVTNDEQMKKIVANRKGAVGYISASALDGSVKKMNVR